MSFTSCTRNAAGEQARLIAFGPAWLRSALCLLGKWLNLLGPQDFRMAGIR